MLTYIMLQSCLFGWPQFHIHCFYFISLIVVICIAHIYGVIVLIQFLENWKHLLTVYRMLMILKRKALVSQYMVYANVHAFDITVSNCTILKLDLKKTKNLWHWYTSEQVSIFYLLYLYNVAEQIVYLTCCNLCINYAYVITWQYGFISLHYSNVLYIMYINIIIVWVSSTKFWSIENMY